jgi:hypothetical protein
MHSETKAALLNTYIARCALYVLCRMHETLLCSTHHHLTWYLCGNSLAASRVWPLASCMTWTWTAMRPAVPWRTCAWSSTRGCGPWPTNSLLSSGGPTMPRPPHTWSSSRPSRVCSAASASRWVSAVGDKSVVA